MSTTIPGTTIKVYTESDNLALSGTFSGGVLPTTAGLFAPGCLLSNINNGDRWINAGTTAAPVWDLADKTVTVNLTAQQIIDMYTTPVEIVPGIPNRVIALDSMDFVITRTSTAFTGGGVSVLQYSNTGAGAGTAVIATITAATITGAAGTTYTTRIPVNQSTIASATLLGIGLFISNQTAVFAAGTGTATVKVKYRVI